MSKVLMFLLFLLTLAASSCGDDSTGSTAPVIEYLGINDDTLMQSSLNIDSIFLRISFEDQDGDIGGTPMRNLVIIDKRTDEEYDAFRLPELPKVNDGIEGEVTVRIFTTCCIFPENIPPCEAPPQFPENELVLEIFMVDDAGNESNRVLSSPITLLCN